MYLSYEHRIHSNCVGPTDMSTVQSIGSKYTKPAVRYSKYNWRMICYYYHKPHHKIDTDAGYISEIEIEKDLKGQMKKLFDLPCKISVS